MLEIIAIVVLTGRLKTEASSKGRSGWWAGLLPVLWILGQVTGGVVAAIAGLEGVALYLGAVGGAVVGAGAAWAIVRGLAPGPLWDDGAGVHADGVPGGHEDPSNPYNAPRA